MSYTATHEQPTHAKRSCTESRGEEGDPAQHQEEGGQEEGSQEEEGQQERLTREEHLALQLAIAHAEVTRIAIQNAELAHKLALLQLRQVAVAHKEDIQNQLTAIRVAHDLDPSDAIDVATGAIVPGDRANG